ncbi:TolC family protein [Sphingobacterium sp. 40-24]|uniref:TolC family protein n=1 Tax=Sphingobacterium sp. 40-24 TaxID=1895843 RepID=UPI000AC6DF71|nr:TolC family protein [Sphingobacterium sp. 40-24]
MNNAVMKYCYLTHVILLLILLHVANRATAQGEALTLERCYTLAKANYPAIKKMDLITKTGEYTIQNANKRFLPQISFSGQATYQSQTVSFADAVGSLPGISLPSISKDQYKIQGEISQLIYDAGNIKMQTDLIAANTALEEQTLVSSLYGINQRINSLYFAVLLIDAQLKQNELNKANLQTQVQKAEAAFDNGVAFRSNVEELKAEVLNIEMQTTEYTSNRTAYLNMLSLFIGKKLPESMQLELPTAQYTLSAINRPELKAFDLQTNIVDQQEKQLKSDYLPQVSGFFQGAYGRPTLNIIENKFGPWYVTGLRFSWSLSSFYSLSNKRNILQLNRQSIDADKETFLLNAKVDLSQQGEQVNKYTILIRQDDAAIALRTSVTQSAEAQLSNGVITTHEYIQKLNAEHLAKQLKILHEIQLLQAIYNLKFIAGN